MPARELRTGEGNLVVAVAGPGGNLINGYNLGDAYGSDLMMFAIGKEVKSLDKEGEDSRFLGFIVLFFY